jgi:hypothetical protein
MRFLQSMPRSLRLAVALLLTGCLCLAAAEAAPALPASGAPAWQVDATHNLCGLTQARQLSSPAQVDLEALLEATPEVRRLRAERISDKSAAWAHLMEGARKRVLRACERERAASGWCSVWSRIRHRRGGQAPDITSGVAERMARDLTPVELPR